MVASIIRFLNIVLVALLAGTSFGIWVGFNPKNYSYATYVDQQQHLVLSLNSLMVSMVIVSTLITILFSEKIKRYSSFCFWQQHFLGLVFLFQGLGIFQFNKKY